MDSKRICLGVLLVGTLILSGCMSESGTSPSRFGIAKGGDDRNGPYDVIPGWWKPASDHNETWTWGSAAGVWPDTPDRVLVVMWGDERREPQMGEVNELQRNFLVAVDRDGNITENWSQWDSIFNRPHQIYINPYDPERAFLLDERGGNGVH